MTSDHTEILEQARGLCRRHEAELVFLTLFGADLYGTARPGRSDLDLRGLFLPTPEALALGNFPRSLHFSTGRDDRRNRSGDVDIDLWSVQRLIQKLADGDIGAMDLIFAPTSPAAVIHRGPQLDLLFNNPLRLLDTVRGRAYAEYSLGQAKKYGIKGSRLGAFRLVNHWLEAREPIDPRERLEPHLAELAAIGGAEDFCGLEEIQGSPGLNLGGKLFAGRMKLAEFAARVRAEMARYGGRAAEAEANRGLDFKALSHAVRALSQVAEIFETGKLTFPLKNRDELLAIKEGRLSWAELEPLILARLGEVDRLREEAPFQGRHDAALARRVILSCYGLASEGAAPAAAPQFEEGFAPPRPAVAAIEARLDRIEAEHGVRILCACESGRRGRGFASPDSGFAVRFIYVHPEDWYLSLKARRGVLEWPPEDTPAGVLDLGGWELRKALGLFRRSDVTLLEWLSSPLVYREVGSLRERLRQWAPAAVNPGKIWRHYHRMMAGRLNKERPGGRTVKDWFHILRPLLALRWLERRLTPPPMRFDQLMAGALEEPGPLSAVKELMEKNGRLREGESLAPDAVVAAFVEEEAIRLAAGPPPLPRPAGPPPEALDELFRNMVRAGRRFP